MDRKLAAILAADVVGYSAMMERDEAGTHERLQSGRRELFEPTIARHHGAIFKLMGDGMLAEFPSVVEAVECAVALQRGLAERNADVPADRQVKVRIGINLGEVIIEGNDRFGEGVNIAARLEQLAEPGGIWVSAKVAREVEKKLAFGFESMGNQKVKNIVEPVQAYRVTLDNQTGPRPRVPARRWLPVAAALLVLTAAAVAGWAWRHGQGANGPEISAPTPRKGTSYRRSALQKHERRSEAGLLQRRNDGKFDLEVGGRHRNQSDLAQFYLDLQRQTHRCSSDCAGFECRLRN